MTTEEDKQVINIHLHGNDGQRIGDNEAIRFKLHDQINLVGKLCFISLTEFQCLNSIYNITSSNNVLFDQTIDEGFYHTRDLLKQIQTLLPAGLNVYFNENTLRFLFENVSVPFTLTGSILNYLGIENPVSVLKKGTYQVESTKPFDLYKRCHSIYVISKNIRTSSNVSEESSASYMSEKLAKIDVPNQFGEYIVYYSQGASNRSLVYDSSISTIDILLTNDYGEKVLMDNDFSLSLKLEVYDLKDNAWLDEINMDKKFMFAPHQYPIIQENIDYIQMKIDELNRELIPPSLNKNKSKSNGRLQKNKPQSS